MKDYRVVLHAHSTWSYDGHWTLPEIARLFDRMGADAVFMTEHDTGFAPDRFAEFREACDTASTSRCRLVPGIEYSSPDNRVHILTWGLDRFLAEHRPVIETLADVAQFGGVALFAHPARRDAWEAFDPEWTPLLHGMEVWNRKTDGLTVGERALELVEETGLPATVGVDFHRLRHLYPLTMRVPRASGDIERDVIEGLRSGKAQPHVAGRSLFDANGRPDTRVHEGLERMRKRIVKLIR